VDDSTIRDKIPPGKKNLRFYLSERRRVFWQG
jgi:hypothetical protein